MNREKERSLSVLHRTIERRTKELTDICVAFDLLFNVVFLPFGIAKDWATNPALESEHEALNVLPDEIELKYDKQDGHEAEYEVVNGGVIGSIRFVWL